MTVTVYNWGILNICLNYFYVATKLIRDFSTTRVNDAFIYNYRDSFTVDLTSLFARRKCTSNQGVREKCLIAKKLVFNDIKFRVVLKN